jgi:hypothetical protein
MPATIEELMILEKEKLAEYASEGWARRLALEKDRDELIKFLRWATGMPPEVWDSIPEPVRIRWQELLHKERPK